MLDGTRQTYWLYQWIDELGIHSIKDLNKAAKRGGNIDRLEELSDLDDEMPLHERVIDSGSVVAGQRIDLSGIMGCSHFECVVPQIDSIFSRMWHYFDSVTVESLPFSSLTARPDRFYYNLEQRVRLLLHLRKIGAEPYLNFVPKPRSYCAKHYHENATKHGIDIILDENLKDNIIARLASESRITIETSPEGWRYSLNHRNLEPVFGGFSHDEDIEDRPTPHMVADEVFGRYCSSLIADMSTSKSLKIPLIQALEPFWVTANSEYSAPQEQVVALQMRLPVLIGVPAKELLRIRKNEWPHFEKFRSALRVAIREQIDRDGERDPAEIAQSVVDEYVIPELADIERKFQSINKNLTRKVGANISLGGAATSVGALASAPLIIAAGATAIAASLAQAYKYFDDKSQVELSDLYFLWKAAVRHGKQR